MRMTPSHPRSPKVSVVCAWYNRADFVRDTVDSLLAQDFDDYEIVLVNDGSPDPRVREILDSYDTPRLRVIHQANAGFVSAIRKAIDSSGGEYIAVMGAGDASLPARLRKQAEFLDTHPDHIGVACGLREAEVDRDWKIVKVRDLGLKARPEITHEQVLGRIHSPFTHGEVMYRRSAYEAVGGYRPFFRFTQDLDLWCRMSRYGGKYAVIPDVLYERRLFAGDGIATDMQKHVAQITLAVMALQCAREWDRQGFDSIDVFGMQAGMFREPSAYLASYLARIAVKYLKAGLVEEARYFAALSWKEHHTRDGRLARSMIAMQEGRLSRPLVQAAFRFRKIQDPRQVKPIPVLRQSRPL
ncbi:glycosyltransferase [Haematobacter massiliensis]